MSRARSTLSTPPNIQLLKTMATYKFERNGVTLEFTDSDLRQVHGLMQDSQESGTTQAHGYLLQKADDGLSRRLVREFGDVYQPFLERARAKQAAFDKQYGPVTSEEYKVLEPYSANVFADLRPDEQEELTKGIQRDFGAFNDASARELAEKDFNAAPELYARS
jgi:hypothetical protein